MKALKKIICGALTLSAILALTPVNASAATKTYRYDFNGDGVKDTVKLTYEENSFYSADEDVYYSDGITYKIYFNGKKILTKKNQNLTGLTSKVIRLSSVTLLDVEGKSGAKSRSILYRLSATKATEVYNSGKMFKHTNYLYTYSNPIYRVSGNTVKVCESNAFSRAVGGFTTTVYYRYKNGSLIKKHSIYSVYNGKYPAYLKAKKKLVLYKTYTSKKKAYTVKKGQQVRLLKVYDGKQTPRFYVSVKGTNKRGWLKAITNRGMNQHVYFSNNDFTA